MITSNGMVNHQWILPDAMNTVQLYAISLRNRDSQERKKLNQTKPNECNDNDNE